MLALLGALREEIIDLQEQLKLEETSTWQGYHIARGRYENRDILLIETGIGKAKAESAAELVLSHYPITAALSIGFAGALTEEPKVGDLIICSTLHCANGLQTRVGSEKPLFSDTNLVSTACQSGAATAHFRCGSCVTSPQLALKPEAKLRLSRAFGADIVDMESYWVAKAAAEWHVPFMAIRAVSDAAGESLLPFDQLLTPNGKLRREKTALYFLIHPHHLVRLLVMYRNAQHARRRLTNFIRCLLAEV